MIRQFSQIELNGKHKGIQGTLSTIKSTDKYSGSLENCAPLATY